VWNVVETELAKNFPFVLFSPEAPPGTVTVTLWPGPSGASCTYSIVVGESRCHEPGTEGLSVGIGLDDASGALKATLIAAEESTVAAFVGVDATTVKGVSVGVAVTAGSVDFEIKRKTPAPTTQSETTTAAMTKGVFERLDVWLC
jgi:hypothetical protein